MKTNNVCIAVITCLSLFNHDDSQYGEAAESLYAYSDNKVYYATQVKFVDSKKILFNIYVLNKSTGKVCKFEGEAVSRYMDTGTSEDENGVGYLTKEYRFEKGQDYLYFAFQASIPIRFSKRLEITASTAGMFKDCDYNTEYYILYKQKK